MEVVPDGWCCTWFSSTPRCSSGVCIRSLGLELCRRHWCVELDLPDDATLEAVVAELGRREAEGAA